MASRTSVTSENITVAPARINRSEAKPSAGLAVMPENASLPPHCMPRISSEAGTVSRRRWSSLRRRTSASAMICSIISPKPVLESCRRYSHGSRKSTELSPSCITCSACNFSQPRLITSASPPRLGLRARLRTVRIGI
ncbi:hypothetical protein D9M68_737140 [compost metagenome]